MAGSPRHPKRDVTYLNKHSMHILDLLGKGYCGRGYLHYIRLALEPVYTTDTQEYECWSLTSCAKTFDTAPLRTRSTVFIALA